MYTAFCKFTWHPSAPWAFIATLENNENDRVCELTFPKPDFNLDDTAKAGSLIASSDPAMWDSLTADELAALQKGARRATDQLNRVSEIENYNRRKLIFITIAFAALIAGALLAILVHIRRNYWRKRLDICTKEMRLRVANAAALW